MKLFFFRGERNVLFDATCADCGRRSESRTCPFQAPVTVQNDVQIAAPNRLLDLKDGRITISSVSTGIEFCNITVDAAELDITVSGEGWGVADSTGRDLIFSTVSGDPGIGNVSIRVAYFNQWNDQYFAMRAKTIDVNGGNLYFSSMCRGGVLYTVSGSDFTFDNCDIVIEGGQDIGVSDGTNPSAINAQSGNEHITVTDTTIAVFKNFVIGIAGWSGFTSEERVTLTVEGLLINDGYVTTIDSWDNTYQYCRRRPYTLYQSHNKEVTL